MNVVRWFFKPLVSPIVAIVFLVALFLWGCGGDDADAAPRENQRANDTILPQSCYDDYFVNDSDGSKDSVFTVYTERCGIVDPDGHPCMIVKTYEGNGASVGVDTICSGASR